MSKINLMALGGLDEKAKNLYVVEIDSKIIVIDSGIYEPLSNNFGVEHIIPRTEYLIKNKDKVVGILLSQPDAMQLGSLPILSYELENIPIYGSKLTIDSLPIFFEGTEQWNTNIVKSGEVFNVSGIEVKPFELTSAKPGNLGYSIRTNDGNIVYMTDFIFDTINEFKNDMMKELSDISNENNLILMIDSHNAGMKNSISPSYRITSNIEKIVIENPKERVVAVVYEDELINIVEIINVAKKYKRKVMFLDQRMIELTNKTLEYLGIEENVIKPYDKDDNNSIIIISGNRTELYKRVNNYIEENSEENFAFKETDIVTFAAPAQSGNEHVYADIMNKISRTNPTIASPDLGKKHQIHPTQFDFINIMSFVKPKIVMPIKGYYKEMIQFKDIAMQLDINEKDVIIAKNGEVFEIDNGSNNGPVEKIKEVGDQIVQINSDSELNSATLKEREELGKNGLVSISALLDKDSKELLSRIDIQMRGVVFVKNQDRLLKSIESIIKETIEQEKEDFKIGKVQAIVKKETTKAIRKEIKIAPAVIVNLVVK